MSRVWLRSPLLRHLCNGINNVKERILTILDVPSRFDDFSSPTILINVDEGNLHLIPSKQQPAVLDGIIGNGILWAVQTHRRSAERRLTRKLSENKLTKPKKNLVICNVCGHFHEVHTICGNCYQKVQEETELMKESIQQEWKLDLVDKEVIVVYNNDTKDDSEYWNGKRIVEMKKERPEWFHHNLKVRTKSHDAITETNLQQTSNNVITHNTK